MKRTGMKRKIVDAMPNQHLNVYEVSPTIPGPNDKYRNEEVSKSITEWKVQHNGIKAH
jgi:hypothetical protein